ncbi:hypothetical protein C0992_013363 [Termitomyces sp. T32_za158]|nr:hypothetical protein C0992_013363 [Termitomyces sp. T32_za158]
MHIEHFLKLYSKEAILWGQLSHPNILPIYGLFHREKCICFVSLWMSNGNINEYLKKNPGAPRQKLAVDVASGLQYLHSEGIIHGDLKGVNVLVDDAGRACLADFGLSSVSDPSIISWTSASAPSSKGGTKGWQAPELFPDDQRTVKNTEASDMYAWGCVCMEIFTGKHPQFRRYPMTRVEVPSPSWTDWGLTEEIWSCMERCWDQEPSNRPSAGDVVHFLSTAPQMGDTPQLEFKPSPAEFRRKMCKPVELITVETLDHFLSELEAEKDELGEDESDLVIL